MTLQQQAYNLIDRLPEDRVEVVIQVMIKMMTVEDNADSSSLLLKKEDSPKMKAYKRMQQLREETAKYDISAVQREIALDEKFGAFG
ncbi:MAG: hypothetical protein IJ188_08655 [Clostridia bacterium]|nr:hypothetical protein [Clostridia bacterium]